MDYVGKEPGHDDQFIYSGLNAKMNILYEQGAGMSGILKHGKQTFLLENCQGPNLINWKGNWTTCCRFKSRITDSNLYLVPVNLKLWINDSNLNRQ